MFLVPLGYALAPQSLAVHIAGDLTAYIRVTGGSLGLAQDFRGPQAKPHRMFVMTVACLAAAAELALRGSHRTLLVAVVIIALGSALTCVNRSLAIARQLRARSAG